MFDYPYDHRVSRFEEALRIIAPLLREGQADYRGTYYSANNAILAPRGPSPAGPSLLIGGTKPRMLRLIARYADLYNTDSVRSVAQVRELAALVGRACEEIGRDPATLPITTFLNVRVLEPGERAQAEVDTVAGTPEEVAARLTEFADAGVAHLIIRFERQGTAGIARFAPVVELLDRA